MDDHLFTSFTFIFNTYNLYYALHGIPPNNPDIILHTETHSIS